MKIRNPYNKDSLSIKRSLRVLEVGPGGNPTRRADVLTEKFLDNNSHRGGDLRLYPHQTLIQGDGENLPFRDMEFDYVICSHVLEHADNSENFLKEQFRVASMGYIEIPSLIGEILAPKHSHKWVILEIDNKLILYEKSKLPYKFETDFGYLFLNYLPYQSLPFRLLLLSRVNVTTVRYEWKNSIDYIINPEDDYYSSFFLKTWTPEMVRKIFPPTSSSAELYRCFKAFLYFSKEIFSRLIGLGKMPISLEAYGKMKRSAD